MRQVLLSVLNFFAFGQPNPSPNPNLRGQPIRYQEGPKFNKEDEVYRIHFYPVTSSDQDEFVLFKVSTFDHLSFDECALFEQFANINYTT